MRNIYERDKCHTSSHRGTPWKHNALNSFSLESRYLWNILIFKHALRSTVLLYKKYFVLITSGDDFVNKGVQWYVVELKYYLRGLNKANCKEVVIPVSINKIILACRYIYIYIYIYSSTLLRTCVWHTLEKHPRGFAWCIYPYNTGLLPWHLGKQTRKSYISGSGVIIWLGQYSLMLFHQFQMIPIFSCKSAFN